MDRFILLCAAAAAPAIAKFARELVWHNDDFRLHAAPSFSLSLQTSSHIAPPKISFANVALCFSIPMQYHHHHQ